MVRDVGQCQKSRGVQHQCVGLVNLDLAIEDSAFRALLVL